MRNDPSPSEKSSSMIALKQAKCEAGVLSLVWIPRCPALTAQIPKFLPLARFTVPPSVTAQARTWQLWSISDSFPCPKSPHAKQLRSKAPFSAWMLVPGPFAAFSAKVQKDIWAPVVSQTAPPPEVTVSMAPLWMRTQLVNEEFSPSSQTAPPAWRARLREKWQASIWVPNEA